MVYCAYRLSLPFHSLPCRTQSIYTVWAAGTGRSPGHKNILAYFQSIKGIWWQGFLGFFVPFDTYWSLTNNLNTQFTVNAESTIRSLCDSNKWQKVSLALLSLIHSAGRSIKNKKSVLLQVNSAMPHIMYPRGPYSTWNFTLILLELLGIKRYQCLPCHAAVKTLDRFCNYFPKNVKTMTRHLLYCNLCVYSFVSWAFVMCY